MLKTSHLHQITTKLHFSFMSIWLDLGSTILFNSSLFHMSNCLQIMFSSMLEQEKYSIYLFECGRTNFSELISHLVPHNFLNFYGLNYNFKWFYFQICSFVRPSSRSIHLLWVNIQSVIFMTFKNDIYVIFKNRTFSKSYVHFLTFKLLYLCW